MDFDLDLFRAQFSVFANTDTVLLSVMFDVAKNFIDDRDCPCRMLSGKSLLYALNAMTAHLLYLDKQNKADADDGGSQGGFISSASIGDVSVSKLAPPAKDMWDWWLGQSPYGQALLALLKTVSVGGISIGGMPERLGIRKVGGVFL